MTIRSSGYKFLFICLLAVLLPSSLAFADGATVDCSGATPGAFTTITAALASLPAAGPNSISVTGTCHENVVMSGRTDLTIFGNPTATVVPGNANGHLLAIDASQSVGIQNITFDGGRGALVNDNSRVDSPVSPSRTAWASALPASIHWCTLPIAQSKTARAPASA